MKIRKHGCDIKHCRYRAIEEQSRDVVVYGKYRAPHKVACELASYFVGRSVFPINYNIPRLLFYCAVAAVLYVAAMFADFHAEWVNLIFRTVLLILYMGIVCRTEHITIKQLIHIRR